MKKAAKKSAKTMKTCAMCGAKVTKSKGAIAKGKFYCADCK